MMDRADFLTLSSAIQGMYLFIYLISIYKHGIYLDICIYLHGVYISMISIYLADTWYLNNEQIHLSYISRPGGTFSQKFHLEAHLHFNDLCFEVSFIYEI